MTDKIEQQKQVANKILKKLKMIDPCAILAGGAPRDWYFGNEANDLDFYFVSSAVSTGAVIAQLNEAFDVKVRQLCEAGTGEHSQMYKTMAFLRAIYETEVDGVKVQFIQLKSPGDTFKVVDSMSCSICKAWYTESRGVVLEQDFKLTVSSGVMFLSDGYKWDDRHPSKMKDRFYGVNKFKLGTKDQAMNILVNKALGEV